MVKQPRNVPKALPQIGWREWVNLPDFADARIKAKIDTGAKTSAIHARYIREERDGERLFVTFDLHPKQRTAIPVIPCRAEVVDRRKIRNSGGMQENRYVIRTTAFIGVHEMEIELTLTRRDAMGFRMLIGRDAVKRRFLIDPGRSYLQGQN